MIVQIRVIWNVRGFRLAGYRVFLNGDTVNFNIPFFKIKHTNYCPDGRCFACTVMADKAINIASLDH
ncbi:hypothetical protein D3C79_1071750 [compost metagenome]